MRLISTLAVVFFATLSQAADPKTPNAPKFLDVAPPQKSDVTPKVDPSAVQKLTGEQIYHAVAQDTTFLILASRPELVEIIKDGPVKFRAPWSDIGGKYETRDIKTKFNAFVKAAKPDLEAAPSAKTYVSVELFLIPDGAKDEKEIVRKTIDVDVQGAIPPPKPKPDPEVKVDPKPDVKPKGEFRVLFVYDRFTNLSQEQLNILNSTDLAAWLGDNVAKDSDGRAGWRSWGQDIVFNDKTLKWWKDAWASVKPKLGKLPQVVIFIGTEGQIYALPDTEAKTLQFLKDQKAQAEGK